MDELHPIKPVSIRRDIINSIDGLRYAMPYHPWRYSWMCIKGLSGRASERITCFVRRKEQPQWVFSVAGIAGAFYSHEDTEAWKF